VVAAIASPEVLTASRCRARVPTAPCHPRDAGGDRMPAIKLAVGSRRRARPIVAGNRSIAADAMNGQISGEFVSHKPMHSVGVYAGIVIAWIISPLVILLGLCFVPLVLMSSKECPIWRQRRVGYRGADVWVLKFSTMNATAGGELRETWFGRLIRPTGLDEILQVLAIAKGDMQWFGPRPLLRADINQLYIDSVLAHTKPGFFNSRSLATGMGNRALQDGSISLATMIRYDRADLERWSFMYGLTLFLRTIALVVRRGRVSRLAEP
jgi:lipopolysaccharide/colanic/teichoic acid biosynthesis glycosyltransferase